MKILYSQIAKRFQNKPPIHKFCDDLTMLGIEVDSVKRQKNDYVIDFDITPNRGDCFSIDGLVRDYAAYKKIKLKKEKISFKASNISFSKKITLNAKDACPIYSSIILRDINLVQKNGKKKKLPDYISKSLKAAEINSIHPLVDIINFVMLETGQPMHVFDLDQIDGDLQVRYAKPKEKIKILAGDKLSLKPDCLVIADKKSPIAFAGISGSSSHSVSKKSKNFLIESAFFSQKTIRGKARKYGFQTDASQRFERGVDFNLHTKALKVAVNLINEIYGCKYSQIKTALNSYMPKNKIINTKIEVINQKLGLKLKENQIINLLSPLGIKLKEKNSKSIMFEAPSHRYDLEIEEDLVEEVARLVGYDNLPLHDQYFSPQKHEDSNSRFLNDLKQLMVNKGFLEVINYSFLDSKTLEKFNLNKGTIELKNPLNKSLSTMRTSLLPSMASNLEYNTKRNEQFIKIFEIGKVFSKEIRNLEKMNFSALVYDNEKYKNWNVKSDFGFYYLKSIAEDILKFTNQKNYSFIASSEASYHPNISADIYLGKNKIGSIGEIHPALLKKTDLKKPFHILEFELDLLERQDQKILKNASIFPSIQRDFSFEVSKSVNFDEIEKLIKESTSAHLKNVKIFDVYTGTNISAGNKSIALKVTWESSKRTLIDEEITKESAKIVSSLKKKFKAILR